MRSVTSCAVACPDADHRRSVRPHDYLAELALAAPLPDLELVVVVDAHGPFPAPDAESLTWREVLAADKPFGAPATVDPDAPAFVCYTSGTTSDAKGVVHSHRTFLAELRQGAALRGPADPAMVKVQGGLSGAPVGHVGGMLMLFGPIVAGSGLNLLDRWDPGLVLRTMAAEHLTSGSGATFFLTSLLDHPEFDPAVHAPLLAHVGMGGAPIPAEVARRATELGISLTRSYGSTEHPSITGSSHDDPEHVRLYTDGAPLPGVDLRLVDEDGRDVPVGTPGEILSRGPERFVGYVDPALTAAAIDADGWYATGDVGVLDERGTSPSPTARRTSSSAAGRTSAPRRSKRSLLHAPRRARGRSRRGTRPPATASTRARSCA